MGRKNTKASLRILTSDQLEQLKQRVSQNIRERRKHMHLSQFDIARRAKTNYHKISQLEAHPEMINLTLKGLWWVANALECRVADLVSEPEPAKADFQGLLPGTPQHRLAEVAKRLPPHHAKKLLRQAEDMIATYYAALGRIP